MIFIQKLGEFSPVFPVNVVPVSDLFPGGVCPRRPADLPARGMARQWGRAARWVGEEDDIQDWHEEGKNYDDDDDGRTHYEDPTSVSNLAGPLVATVGALLLGLVLA